jgi:hypothetical protein
MKTLAKPIEMISVTSENGNIKPIKFRIITSEGEAQIYKVYRVYHTVLEKLAGNRIYKFTCEIVVNNQKKICELRYELDSCKWMLFKI